MSADQYLQFAAHQRLVDDGTFALARRARQQGDLHANGIGQRPDSFQMLPSQYFGGCHDAGLVSVIQSNQCSHESDNRLTAAHISLQEAVHLFPATHVMAHLADDTLLCSGKRELKHIMIKSVEVSAHIPEDVAHEPATVTFYIMQNVELQEKQLFELESQLRLLQCPLVGRHMDISQGVWQRHEPIALQQVGWQRLADVLHRRCIQQVEH